MSPHDPPQAFVDNFIRLLTDADVTEFQRVLEMKVRNVGDEDYKCREVKV